MFFRQPSCFPSRMFSCWITFLCISNVTSPSHGSGVPSQNDFGFHFPSLQQPGKKKIVFVFVFSPSFSYCFISFVVFSFFVVLVWFTRPTRIAQHVWYVASVYVSVWPRWVNQSICVFSLLFPLLVFFLRVGEPIYRCLLQLVRSTLTVEFAEAVVVANANRYGVSWPDVMPNISAKEWPTVFKAGIQREWGQGSGQTNAETCILNIARTNHPVWSSFDGCGAGRLLLCVAAVCEQHSWIYFHQPFCGCKRLPHFPKHVPLLKWNLRIVSFSLFSFRFVSWSFFPRSCKWQRNPDCDCW